MGSRPELRGPEPSRASARPAPLPPQPRFLKRANVGQRKKLAIYSSPSKRHAGPLWAMVIRRAVLTFSGPCGHPLPGEAEPLKASHASRPHARVLVSEPSRPSLRAVASESPSRRVRVSEPSRPSRHSRYRVPAATSDYLEPCPGLHRPRPHSVRVKLSLRAPAGPGPAKPAPGPPSRGLAAIGTPAGTANLG